MKRYGQNPCTLGRVLQRFLQLVWLASLAMRRGAPCLQRTQRGLLPSCCRTARLGSTCVSPLHQISRRPASAGYTAGLPLCGGLFDAPVAKGSQAYPRCRVPAAPLAGALLICISAVPVSCCAHPSAPDVWQIAVLGSASSIPSHAGNARLLSSW